MNQPKTFFGVFIIKKDQNVMQIVQTENYEEARKAWQELTDQWTRCILDRKPFILDNGINASAFDPGLINEVVIKATELTNRINPNNPYASEMQRTGFGNSFSRFTGSTNPQSAEELLDRGFQF